MMLNSVLNIIVIVLLAVGTFYVWRLQKTLNGLGKSRMDMERFVAEFSTSITRAQKAIGELHHVARDVGDDVEGHIKRAQTLRDELAFLVEAADHIATRLSESTSIAQADAKLIRQNHADKANGLKHSEPYAAVKEETQKYKPQEEKSEPVTPQPALESSVKTVPSWIKRAEHSAQVINAPVESVAPVSGLQFGVKSSPQNHPDGGPGSEKRSETLPREQPRSQAERELLQALEKMK